MTSCGEKEKTTLPILFGNQHDVRAGPEVSVTILD